MDKTQIITNKNFQKTCNFAYEPTLLLQLFKILWSYNFNKKKTVNKTILQNLNICEQDNSLLNLNICSVCEVSIRHGEQNKAWLTHNLLLL